MVMVRRRQRQRRLHDRHGDRRRFRRPGAGRPQTQPRRRVHPRRSRHLAARPSLPAVERGMTPPVVVHPDRLRADPSRVVAQLFLPGEGVASTHSRAAQIVERVLALPPEAVSALAADLLADFGPRHIGTADLLRANARAVGSRVQTTIPITEDQSIVLGATFTAEYAVEAAALCNPSAVEHPDQSGLLPGQLRVAVALRAIGEGHISSIEFTEAVIGPGDTWAFAPRHGPVATATILPARWHSSRLRAALEHEDQVN